MKLFRHERNIIKTPEEEEEFQKFLEEEGLTEDDQKAMLRAAFLTLYLPCIGLILLLSAIVLALFGFFR